LNKVTLESSGIAQNYFIRTPAGQAGSVTTSKIITIYANTSKLKSICEDLFNIT